MFPIKNMAGKIYAFIGRDTTGTLNKKYYIEPEHVTLKPYPSNPAPIKDRIIVVEGIFDLLNLYDKGLKNVTTIFGVSNFKQDTIENLKIQGISGIDIVLDGDDAGRKGAEKIKILCEENNFSCRNVKLKDGTDPGNLSQREVIKLREKLYE